MLAYILVMKNPYFGVTDAAGSFTIPDRAYFERFGLPAPPALPEGKYLVKTWHEKLKSSRISLTLPESEKDSLELELRRGTPGVLYK